MRKRTCFKTEERRVRGMSKAGYVLPPYRRHGKKLQAFAIIASSVVIVALTFLIVWAMIP